MRNIERLYHLAEASNLESILKHGLMSTERLLDAAGMSEEDRIKILRDHRQQNLRLRSGVVIRHQRPMPPTALARALDEGLQPVDWYALLNGFVFLWPDKDRMTRQRHACGDTPQVLFTFNGIVLLDCFGPDAFVSAINSGNARRQAARRGRNTFVPYPTWIQHGWPRGQRTRPPAEIVFRCVIPANASYVIDITEV